MCCRVHLATHSLCLLVQPHRHHCIRLVGGFYFSQDKHNSRETKKNAWFVEALVVICSLFLSLKRNLAESSTLKRSEAGRPVPSITISIPKPSFAPSAAADKISTLHKTGYYRCFNITWNLMPDSYVNIYLKYFFLFFVKCKQSRTLPSQSCPLQTGVQSESPKSLHIIKFSFLLNSLLIYRHSFGKSLCSFDQKNDLSPILILFWGFISNFTLFHYCIRLETHTLIQRHG